MENSLSRPRPSLTVRKIPRKPTRCDVFQFSLSRR